MIYTGGGFKGFLPGIPARDLTSEEVVKFGGEATLLTTGLYELPKQQRRVSKKKEEVKHGRH